MPLIDIKLIMTATILIMTLISGFPLFFRKTLTAKHTHLPIAEIIACGVFLGVAVIFLLPEVNHESSIAGISIMGAYAICAGAYLFLLLVDICGSKLQSYNTSGNLIVLIAIIMLILHSFVEGTALGFSRDLSPALLLFIAILSHKWAESFVLAMQLRNSTYSAFAQKCLFFLFSLMTPLGIFAGTYTTHITTNAQLICVITAITAGIFLYMGTLHGLKRSVMIIHCRTVSGFAWLSTGFALILAVAYITPH